MDQLNNANPKVEEMEKEIRAQVGKVNSSGLHIVYLDYYTGVPKAAKDIIIKIYDVQRLIYGQVREGPQKILNDFTGTLQTNGYTAYNIFDKPGKITLLACMAHARRKLRQPWTTIRSGQDMY